MTLFVKDRVLSRENIDKKFETEERERDEIATSKRQWTSLYDALDALPSLSNNRIDNRH